MSKKKDKKSKKKGKKDKKKKKSKKSKGYGILDSRYDDSGSSSKNDYERHPRSGVTCHIVEDPYRDTYTWK